MAKSVIKKSLPSRSLTHERQRASFGTCTLDMAYTSLGVDLIQKLYVAPLYVVPLCWERASFSTCALDMTYTSLGVDLIQKLCLVPLCLEGRFDRSDFGTCLKSHTYPIPWNKDICHTLTNATCGVV